MSDYTPDVEYAMEKAYYDEAYEETMTDRIQLGKHTWIENGYCYTTSHEVAAAWWRNEAAEWSDDFDECDEIVGPSWWSGIVEDAEAWRLPVSALPEVYGYVDGEPWSWIFPNNRDAPKHLRMEHCLVGDNAQKGPFSHGHPLHLRAVIPCDGSADSLRALWSVIEEVRNDRE